MMTARLIMITLTLSLSLTCSASNNTTPAFSDKNAEYAAKAEMVKTLIEMISWPSKITSRKSLILCIPDDFEYGDQFKRLNGKSINKMTLKIVKIKDPLTTKTQCQLIYVTDSEKDQIPQIIDFYKKKSVVLIGDMDRFALRGGSMNFVFLNRVLAITVNTDVMRDAKLPINLKSVEQITVVPQLEDLKPTE